MSTHSSFTILSPESGMRGLEIEKTRATNLDRQEEPNSSPRGSGRRALRESLNTTRAPPQQQRCNECIGSNQRQTKKTLVAGFIRLTMSKQSVMEWPSDLTNFVLDWFDETSYWLIRGELMKEFNSLQNGETMYGPKFRINNLCEFETTLCPAGWKANQKGSCQFYIELNSFPTNWVTSITVYYELSCTETCCHCKKIRTFHKKSDAQSWGTNNMRLANCAQFDSLEMATMVRVLRIEYTEEYKALLASKELEGPLFECERIALPRRTSFEWVISPGLLSEFKASDDGKFFYSPNFGANCFCFEIAPNGWHITNRGHPMLYLRLLGLPQRVRSIRCLCDFRGEFDGAIASRRIEHTFSYSKHGVQWDVERELVGHTLDVQALDTMNLAVVIHVVGITDDVEGMEIVCDQWSEYQIV